MPGALPDPSIGSAHIPKKCVMESSDPSERGLQDVGELGPNEAGGSHITA